MKTLQIFLVLLAGMFIFNACTKEEGIAPSSGFQPAPKKMTDLVIKSSFDWKTTKTYEFNFTGNVTDFVNVNATDGTSYHKAMLTPQSAYKITLTLPSYETKVHFVYNGKDIEYPLSSATINYKFN